ncbi:MAG: C10 family peptidase, partial [Candidatus Cloacimonetes bacterium]|nr:C10 family peptidase [Candidatus Cloacimonadota bacterium]
MRNIFLITLFILVCTLSGMPVDQETADQTVSNFLMTSGRDASFDFTFDEKNENLFYLYNLEPKGFVMIAGDTDFVPVLGYSFNNDFSTVDEEREIIFHWLNEYQQQLQLQITMEHRIRNNEKWELQDFSRSRFEQWPEEGSTVTGGWIETNWTQTSPYNNMCPIDFSTNSKSVAGCPSIAMAQILNFHREINGTQFTDNDDYYMYFQDSNQYCIDDDADTYDFPAFPELNSYLNEISAVYDGEENLNNTQKAALVFACGVATQQVYSSSVSGNYYDPQIVNAYHKFGFNSAALLYGDASLLFERISENIKAALPAQLCILASDGSGHQVV